MMPRRLLAPLFLFPLLLLAETPPTTAPGKVPAPTPAKDAELTDFVRFVEDSAGARLETGVARYRNREGVIVDLIGAVHVADKVYFERLNELFKSYDAVLYEMVGGPIEKRDEREAAKSDIDNLAGSDDPAAALEAASADKLAWLRTLHETLRSTLELEGQLEVVDYHRPNFVHADLSMTEFEDLQEQRNEGFLTLMLKAMQAQMSQPESSANQPGLLQIMEILCRPDSAVELKRVIGRTFDTVESLMAGMESGEGTVIVTERNKVALKVLATQMAHGKKKLGIFYGAAHLPDLEKRLLGMGFVQESSGWLTAWDLPPPAPVPAPAGEKTEEKREKQ